MSVVLIMAALVVPGIAAAQARLVVHADRGEHTVHRPIYGYFAEHLGRGIYDGFRYRTDTNAEWRIRDDIIDAVISMARS
jgi:alpha-L-arabinofuranosidase